jgi:hypothetical protein
MLDQDSAESQKPLVQVWSVLDAANDLGDGATVDACRRVIDASLRGGVPTQSDIDVVSDFFK